MENSKEILFEFMGILQKLKEYKRWGSTKTFINKESIADHIWKVLVINFVIYKSIKINVDFLKVIKLVLVHDLVEAIAKDTDYTLVYLGIVTPEQKHEKELSAIKEIKEILGGEIGNEIYDLWDEYEKWETPEAKIVKALEKIEPIDHVIFYGYKYIDIPDKFATYNDESMLMVPELKGFQHGYKEKLHEVFIEGNYEWKDNYNTKGDFAEFKNFENIFQFFQIAQKLKETKRYKSMKLNPIKESVAEHSFRLTFFAWLVVDNLKLDIDLQKVLEIAIFHDIAEFITGDIDYGLIYTGKVSLEEKNKEEFIAINKIKELLPKKTGEEIYELWNEYEENKTREAKIVKSLDKLEAIDHFMRHGLDYFYDPDIIVIYFNSSIKLCAEIKPIFELYKDKLKEMYMQGGFERKEKYNI